MSHEEDQPTVASSASLKAGYEVSDVNVLIMAILAIACVLLVAGFAVGLNEYFYMTKERIYQQQVLDVPSPKLIELHEHEAHLLTTYGVVDKEKGIYRIPIDRAMELIAQQSAQKN